MIIQCKTYLSTTNEGQPCHPCKAPHRIPHCSSMQLARMIMLRTSAYVQGAADCDLLWRRPFPLLNAGLTLVAAGHLFVLGPLLVNGMGGNLLPAVVGTWGLGLATASYNWLKNIGK